MTVGILGGAGFVGFALAQNFLNAGWEVKVLDNLSREGTFSISGVRSGICQRDVRNTTDFNLLGSVDWIIDTAANPSVLGGLGKGANRELMMENVGGAINALEHAKAIYAGLVFVSLSRVYTSALLSNLSVSENQSETRYEYSNADKIVWASRCK